MHPERPVRTEVRRNGEVPGGSNRGAIRNMFYAEEKNSLGVIENCRQ